VPLIATGSTSLAVCPQCGRIANPRSTAGPPTAPLAPPEAPPVAPPVSGAAKAESAEESGALGDRRAQELFAAYVTSQPIPCPKCRTPLKHRGVSEYVCPSCGHTVRFPSAGPALPPSSNPTSVGAGRRDSALRSR
jgi:ribosomal protein L37AE/L43A